MPTSTASKNQMSASAALLWIGISIGVGAGVAVAFHLTGQSVPLLNQQNIYSVDGQDRIRPHAQQHVDDNHWRRVTVPETPSMSGN